MFVSISQPHGRGKPDTAGFPARAARG
jgi:hypothetical protein